VSQCSLISRQSGLGLVPISCISSRGHGLCLGFVPSLSWIPLALRLYSTPSSIVTAHPTPTWPTRGIACLDRAPRVCYLSLALSSSLTWTLDGRSSFIHLKRDKEKPEPADSSASLFTMYSQMAEKEHKETAERWQKDADGILIFVSVTITSNHFTRHVKNDRQAYSLLPLRC
jgi:hypothetical protein